MDLHHGVWPLNPTCWRLIYVFMSVSASGSAALSEPLKTLLWGLFVPFKGEDKFAMTPSTSKGFVAMIWRTTQVP